MKQLKIIGTDRSLDYLITALNSFSIAFERFLNSKIVLTSLVTVTSCEKFIFRSLETNLRADSGRESLRKNPCFSAESECANV